MPHHARANSKAQKMHEDRLPAGLTRRGAGYVVQWFDGRLPDQVVRELRRFRMGQKYSADSD